MSALPDGTPLYIGLMSGTSADGIDAALVAFPDTPDSASRCRLLAGLTYPWEPQLRAALIALGEGREVTSLDVLGDLDARVGESFAAAANALLAQEGIAPAQIRASGSHGRTAAP